MKRIYISLICLAVSATTFSQSTGKIILANGQKIVIENTTEITVVLQWVWS